MGGDSGSCLHSLPASTLPSLCCWDPEEQTEKVRNNALSWHLPASALLRAQQSRHLTPRSTQGFQLAQHPPAPGENAVSHPSAPWLGRRTPPSRAGDSSFPDEQSKRRAVKGSAEVPSLQIFPVSFCPCFHHCRTQHGLQSTSVPNLVGISSSTHLAFSPQS